MRAPILKIILEQGLSNVLVVVTRYFGGIKLGTGGLVRAYSDATIKALEQTTYTEKIIGYKAKLIYFNNDIEDYDEIHIKKFIKKFKKNSYFIFKISLSIAIKINTVQNITFPI